MKRFAILGYVTEEDGEMQRMGVEYHYVARAKDRNEPNNQPFFKFLLD